MKRGMKDILGSEMERMMGDLKKELDKRNLKVPEVAEEVTE